MEMTKTYDTNDFNDAYIKDILNEVVETLKLRGYNPINQIVGYLMSGDPGYITNFDEARQKIQSIERSKIIEVLVKEMTK